MNPADFDRRPIIVAIAGPNGAGKTTFYNSFVAPAGLRFINADLLAAEFAVGPYEAAKLADSLRRALVERGESFVFETVLSDPVGDKIAFLSEAAERGYEVLLCFIALDDAAQSVDRVAMRALKGGHSVPTEKLKLRFPRTLTNLAAGIGKLPQVLVFDNSDLRRPFHLLGAFEDGQLKIRDPYIPTWLAQLLV